MPRSARVLALANQKGGVAKTTTTLNLGVGLHDLGARVLAVDLDPPEQPLDEPGDRRRGPDAGHVPRAHGRAQLSEIIEMREIDIAPAGIELAGAELALSAMIGRERVLERRCGRSANSTTTSCSTRRRRWACMTINAMVAADGVVVPVQCEYLSLRGLAQLNETLPRSGRTSIPKVDIVGILPTMYDGRTIHGREAVQLLQESFGDRVYRTRIGKTIRFAEAPVEGKSVIRYDPQGQAARWYRHLAREVWEGRMGMARAGKVAA